ncbi:DUF4348 domain-containing protein [Spongiivirga citrea]|uniref:Uncharacterized protein n=1 Tax=Spongiivirga citrea TaxID=1481457 RepID=A0A6M0CHR0_9FLAO|nr:DUF4348 domain-containing protein [Spongiivirga citrea]NER17506.1 hypothetical protein [Spongiivirga citrea]
MKIISKLLVILLVFSLTSCVDKKKEEAEVKAAVEKVDSLESEVQKLGKEIDTKTKELEDSLQELDSI